MICTRVRYLQQSAFIPESSIGTKLHHLYCGTLLAPECIISDGCTGVHNLYQLENATCTRVHNMNGSAILALINIPYKHSTFHHFWHSISNIVGN
jgi:hypothetical protein